VLPDSTSGLWSKPGRQQHAVIQPRPQLHRRDVCTATHAHRTQARPHRATRHCRRTPSHERNGGPLSAAQNTYTIGGATETPFGLQATRSACTRTPSPTNESIRNTIPLTPSYARLHIPKNSPPQSPLPSVWEPRVSVTSDKTPVGHHNTAVIVHRSTPTEHHYYCT
jgi:hypothetical protein